MLSLTEGMRPADYDQFAQVENVLRSECDYRLLCRRLDVVCFCSHVMAYHVRKDCHAVIPLTCVSRSVPL